MKNSSDNLVFGINAVEELLLNRSNEIDRIYFDSTQVKSRAFKLLKHGRKKKITCHCIPIQKLDQIAGTNKHQGVVALCPTKAYENLENVLINIETSTIPPIFLVPASLEDPRNLGAIIRTSVAFNVSAILLERKKSTPLNATVAKTSCGMLEHMSIVKPKSLEKEIIDLKAKGFDVIGAEGNSTKKPEEVNLKKPVILIIGGEHRGIPPYLKKLCTDLIGIPTCSKVKSLNASVAASILLYECARQRSFVLEG